MTEKVWYVSWVWLWDCSLTHSQSGFSTITVNFSVADLTKQMQNMAGLTTVL